MHARIDEVEHIARKSMQLQRIPPFQPLMVFMSAS